MGITQSKPKKNNHKRLPFHEASDEIKKSLIKEMKRLLPYETLISNNFQIYVLCGAIFLYDYPDHPTEKGYFIYTCEVIKEVLKIYEEKRPYIITMDNNIRITFVQNLIQ